MTDSDHGAPNRAIGAVRIAAAGASDVGKRRKINEDALFVTGGLVVVADGMGGHDAGDVASRLTIDVVAEFADRVPLAFPDLEELVRSANTAVHRYGVANGTEGMGTTLVCAALVDNGDEADLVIVNVGDSRCYELVPEGGLTQITSDHSLVQELVEAGDLDEEGARSHQERNVVTRAVGILEQVAADYYVLERRPSTRLLLCSDGVSGEVSDEQLRVALDMANDVEQAVALVMRAVAETPARDNATAIVVDVVRADIAARAELEMDGQTLRRTSPDTADGGHAEPAPGGMISSVPSGASSPGEAADPPAVFGAALIDEVPTGD
jgi:serine/threonine protein phosphatase PrpC